MALRLITYLLTFLHLGFQLPGITPNDFIAVITKESLSGPSVGNEYFEFTVPSGFSYLSTTASLSFGTIQAQYINYSENKVLGIDIQAQHPKSKYTSSDILLERIDDIIVTIDTSSLSIVNYTSSQGYKGKEFGYIEYGQPKNEILLMPEPNYQIYTDQNLGENVIFVRYYGNFAIERVKEYSDFFRLKNSTSATEAKQNPKDFFTGTELLPNWTDSWFGLIWQTSKSNWIYHLKLGWIYFVPSSTDSNWIYIPGIA